MRRCVALRKLVDGGRCTNPAVTGEVWGRPNELQVVVYLCASHHNMSVAQAEEKEDAK